MQSEQNKTLKYKQNKIQKIPKRKHGKMFHNIIIIMVYFKL